MDKRKYLLTCLMEECAEVAQRASKAIRFGLFETQPGHDRHNQLRLADEINDLLGVLMYLECERIILPPDKSAHYAKMDRIDEYMAYSRKLGELQ